LLMEQKRTEQPNCRIEGCKRKAGDNFDLLALAEGLCSLHYYEQRRRIR